MIVCKKLYLLQNGNSDGSGQQRNGLDLCSNIGMMQGAAVAMKHIIALAMPASKCYFSLQGEAYVVKHLNKQFINKSNYTETNLTDDDEEARLRNKFIDFIAADGSFDFLDT